MSDTEWVVIQEESHEQNARIVQGFLQAQGIEAAINEDDAGDQFPSLEESQGVQILVKAEQAEQARKLLAERKAAAGEEE
jgi:hypothetical protein